MAKNEYYLANTVYRIVMDACPLARTEIVFCCGNSLKIRLIVRGLISTSPLSKHLTSRLALPLECRDVMRCILSADQRLFRNNLLPSPPSWVSAHVTVYDEDFVEVGGEGMSGQSQMELYILM